jgi:MFS transporter, DHA1 family, multidrug resistance protein
VQASRVLSWVAVCTSLSPVLVPLVGGQIASFGAWQTIFAVHAAAGGACLVVALRAVKSSARDPPSRLLQRIAAYGPILRDRHMFGVGFTLANSMARTMRRFPSVGAAAAVFGVN